MSEPGVSSISGAEKQHRGCETSLDQTFVCTTVTLIFTPIRAPDSVEVQFLSIEHGLDVLNA